MLVPSPATRSDRHTAMCNVSCRHFFLSSSLLSIASSYQPYQAHHMSSIGYRLQFVVASILAWLTWPSSSVEFCAELHLCFIATVH